MPGRIALRMDQLGGSRPQPWSGGAYCSNPTSSASHAPSGAKTESNLTFNLNHSVGATDYWENAVSIAIYRGVSIGIFALIIIIFLSLVLDGSWLILIGVVTALFCAAALLVIPIRILLNIELLITFVGVGVIQFYFGIEDSLWASYALAIGIVSRYLLEISITKGRNIPNGIPVFVFLFFSCGILIIVTTCANMSSFSQLAVGIKIYAPIWWLILVVFSVADLDSDNFITGLEKGALALILIQLPFVLHQHFILISKTGSWDVVGGTFGENASGTLLFVLIISILVTLEMYQTKRLSALMAGLFIALSLLILALGEVKAVFIFLPFAIFIQQFTLLRAHPIKFIFLMILVGAVVYFLFQMYEALYWSHGGETLSAENRIDSFLGYFFDPNGYNLITGEVSRGASIALWWNDNQTDLLHRLIGYGAGSSRAVSTIALGEIGLRFFPLMIASTAIAQLLWDVGVIGLLLFALSMVAASFQALRLALRSRNEVERMRMMTILAILAVMLPLLMYNRNLVDNPVEQLTLVLLLGILWRGNSRSRNIYRTRLSAEKPKLARI